MKNIIKKGIIILGAYLVFTLYLFLACERIERLNQNNNLEQEKAMTIISE